VAGWLTHIAKNISSVFVQTCPLTAHIAASNSLLETAEARLDAVEADRDDARRVMKEACEANRVFVARLDAVKNCKTYICVFPDIGKIGPAYRQRDIWEATEQDDWRDVEQAIKEARDG
jgi:hypothetical protein